MDALRLARVAAEDASRAAETAYTEAYPKDVDLSLVERSRASREKSSQLLQQSQRLQQVVVEHQDRLKGEQMTLNGIDLTLKKAATSNDETNAAISKFGKGSS